MKKFILQINNEKFNTPIVCDSIVKQVKFESNYIPISKEYKVIYKIEGLNDIFENIVLI